ncbi:MAG: hypothetical protein WC455_25835 [Dehalococcoidia bacterium]|jgi:DNA-directed RNA polymerase specialized sigma24 family protein
MNIEDLYNKYQKPLVGLARKTIPWKAEDVVQDAFLELIASGAASVNYSWLKHRVMSRVANELRRCEHEPILFSQLNEDEIVFDVL